MVFLWRLMILFLFQTKDIELLYKMNASEWICENIATENSNISAKCLLTVCHKLAHNGKSRMARYTYIMFFPFPYTFSFIWTNKIQYLRHSLFFVLIFLQILQFSSHFNEERIVVPCVIQWHLGENQFGHPPFAL